MSVTITVRTKADPAKAAAFAKANTAKVQAVANQAKSMGAIHHRFVSRDGEIMVIDEWDSAEHFQRFFKENKDIPSLMAAAGATGAPEITVWQSLDMKDAF